MRKTLIRSGLALVALAAALPAAAQIRDESVGDGLQAPLRDLRIDDREIPEVLQLAASAPYSSAGTQNCNAIRASITQIDAALGPDVDQPPAETKNDGNIAAAGTRGLLGALVPGYGLVRILTGADKAEKRVATAVYGGAVRRAYLKGLGTARGCRPPGAATPASRAARPMLAPVEKKEDRKDDKKKD